MPRRGVFVTGTDTGAGKTVVAAALVGALRASGEPVAAFKPVLTGLDDPGPYDDEVIGAEVFHRFGPPVSPHLAAAQAGVTLRAEEIAARVTGEPVVVEGVGGLLVPLSETESVRDLAVTLGLPLVVAARPGLGTINHTLLTLEAARAAGLAVAAVVLTPWPDVPSDMETSNRATIERLGGVAVHTLAHTALDRESLAAAGAALPVHAWAA